ncbi:MAG: efflux RND transporter periplasmic adaptor subunit [Cyanobacteria bacterium P01_C01_bin.89]
MSPEPTEHPSQPSKSLVKRPLSKRSLRRWSLQNGHLRQALRLGNDGWVSSRVILLGFGAGIVVSLGAGIWLSQASGEQDGSDSNDPAVAAEQAEQTGAAKSVTIAPAQPAQIRQFLSATGTVEARELVPVKSQATGLQVMRILVFEGQSVQASQPMAVLDDSILRTQLAQARASLEESRAALAELERGTRPEVIAQAQQREKQAIAGLEQAIAELELATERLKDNAALEAEGAISNDRLMEIRAQARRAKAARDQAESVLTEARVRVVELQRGPRQEAIAQARARLFRAQAQVQELGVRIRQARVVASTTGVVSDRQVKVGDLISNDAELFSIIEGGVVELYLTVPETEISRIRPGLPVRVTSDSDRNLQMVGQVREIDPVIDPTSRQATVKVALRSPAGLRKGMFLRGEVATSMGQGLAIPTASVLPQSDGSSIVYRVKQDRTVESVSVETGEVLPGNWVEIRQGLQPGDAVVVKGAPYLKVGDRINIAGTVTPPVPTNAPPGQPGQSSPQRAPTAPQQPARPPSDSDASSL